MRLRLVKALVEIIPVGDWLPYKARILCLIYFQQYCEYLLQKALYSEVLYAILNNYN